MKKIRIVVIGFAAMLGIVAPLSAQTPLWTGILDPSRAVDWTQAGVVGGIPTRTTICSTLSSGASAAQINSAISSCPSGQVVFLNAGTYNLSTGIVMKSNVTLRGSGANQTFLIFSGSNGCGGWQGDICFMDSTGNYTGSGTVQPGGQYAATWSGGYAQGTTQITLTGIGSAGLSVGQYIYLDQANDTSIGSGFFICDTSSPACSLEGGAPGRAVGGADRNQVQIVRITGINGSTYTITPGLYGQNWSSAKNPGAWWAGMIQGAGVESLSLDHTNSDDESGIAFLNAENNWVIGVRSLAANRNHIWFVQASHNNIQNNYFFGTKNNASQSYGVESFVAGDNLVVNNIFEQVTVPIMNGPVMGSVFAYNFSINDFYYVAGWMMGGLWGGHDAGAMYNLFEGNNTAGFMGDVFHGTSGLSTLFRNRLVGWETGKTEETSAVFLYSYNRYINVVGNVLGQSGYHTTYQGSNGDGATIYNLGVGDTEGNVTVAADPTVASTLMRWGNFDTVNNAVRFVASEVPSGLAQYANGLPSSQALPPSFYLSVAPSWWPSGKPWPAIGPDVTGGNLPNLGGFASTIPAQDCYTSMGGSAVGTGSALTFNASTCYGTAVVVAPPTNLTGIAH
jgi:hypothetical protein